LASSLNLSSEFYMITHQNTSISHELTKEQLISEIKKLEVAPKSGLLGDLLNKAQLIVQQDTSVQYQVFLFSDFQHSNANFQEFKIGSSAFVNIVNSAFVDIYANSGYFDSAIKATTAKLTNLKDGYLPYHISDTAGLGDSPIYTDGTNVSIGTDAPKSKLQINGAVQVGDDTSAASVDKVGALRYRPDGTNASVVEMCMQTGASTYAWEEIKRKTW